MLYNIAVRSRTAIAMIHETPPFGTVGLPDYTAVPEVWYVYKCQKTEFRHRLK
jgi:hypothetical protein